MSSPPAKLLRGERKGGRLKKRMEDRNASRKKRAFGGTLDRGGKARGKGKKRVGKEDEHLIQPGRKKKKKKKKSGCKERHGGEKTLFSRVAGRSRHQ